MSDCLLKAFRLAGTLWAIKAQTPSRFCILCWLLKLSTGGGLDDIGDAIRPKIEQLRREACGQGKGSIVVASA